MFVADENIDAAIVGRLRDDGHDVVWIAESEPGITDDRVPAIAEDQIRILITGDMDFGEIVFRQGRANAGVLLPLVTCEFEGPDLARKRRSTSTRGSASS